MIQSKNYDHANSEIILTDAESVNPNARAAERTKEDHHFVPVIVKRHDQSKIHPDDILERAIEDGVEQHDRTRLSLFLSSIAAGLILGFAAMAVAFVSQETMGLSDGLSRIAMALVYPIGFIITIMSGTQLFTEHTATALYPVLDRRKSIPSLLALWGIVILGNLVGTFFSSLMIVGADSVINAREGYIMVANHFAHFTGTEILLSAILAGWLMAQGGWLVLATPPQFSQIAVIYIVTFLIGIGGLHHSIVGSAELFSGGFLGALEPWVIIKTIAIALFGNLIGGSLFVGVLNYAHIRKTQETEPS